MNISLNSFKLYTALDLSKLNIISKGFKGKFLLKRSFIFAIFFKGDENNDSTDVAEENNFETHLEVDQNSDNREARSMGKQATKNTSEEEHRMLEMLIKLMLAEKKSMKKSSNKNWILRDGR